MTGTLFRFNFNVFRVVHLLKCELTDAVGKCRGEQQVHTLGTWRHMAEQPADIFDKAEIVHTVSFIENDNLNGAQVETALFGEVD